MDQPADHLLVQTACRTKVYVFHAGWPLQSGIPDPPLQRPVLPPVPLPVYQQREALFEAELRRLRFFLLLSKSIGHAAHAHGVQLFDRLLVEHSSPWGLLNYRGIRLRRGIEVIGTADVVVVHAGPNGWIAG